MLKHFRIRHCNCLERLLCNIILNVYADESMIFINSWKFKYDKDKDYLGDKPSIYSDNFDEIYDTAKNYYGISKVESIDISILNAKSKLFKVFKDNKYVSISIKACDCPWLPFLHEIHGNHMILVMDYNTEGVFCSDNTAEYNFISYEFVIEHATQINIFNIVNCNHDKASFSNTLLLDIGAKIKSSNDFQSIKLFANEFTSVSNVNAELKRCELITVPLFRRFSLIGFSRINYCRAIKYIYNEDSNMLSKLDETFNFFNIVSQKWLLLNKILTKYSFTNDEKNLSKVISVLSDISDNECSIVNKMYETLS